MEERTTSRTENLKFLFAVVFVVCLGVMFFTAAGASRPGAPAFAAAASDSGLQLRGVSRWTVGSFGMVEIHGTAINQTGRDLSYAQISFRLLDKDGAQVGTALANVANLARGSKWRFTASGVGTGAVRLETGDISAF